MGRKLHPGGEKALSDVVFIVSCEARKFTPLSKHTLSPPKLSDHIIVAISFVPFSLNLVLPAMLVSSPCHLCLHLDSQFLRHGLFYLYNAH